AGSDPTTSAPQVAVRRQSEIPLTISLEYSVDLDSAQPNWKIQSGNTGPGVDVMYYETRQGKDDGLIQGAGGDVARVQGSRSYRTCEAATGYTGEVKAAPWASYCVRTSERRFAYLTVRSEGAGQGVFDVVVWDPPFASS
ncbi:MAG: hypothetical protein L0I76_37115, partial [Pseudonocardia sp.]|nr:hypothetical protein [Pseudonocardia sp.]